MKELERLLTSSEDELERALLVSVMAEAPSPAGLRDTALALGLTASAAAALLTTLPHAASSLGAPVTTAVLPLGVTAAASGGVTTSTVAASTVATTAGVASLATLGKSLVGGALVSFIALTTVDYTLGTESAPRDQVRAAAVQQAEPRVSQKTRGARAVAVDAALPAEEEEEPVVVPRGGRRSMTRASSPPPLPVPAEAPPPPAAPADELPAPTPVATAPNDASLATETRLLDRARAALARGDTASAGDWLSRYSAAKPSAVLAHEAALLRVRLLLAKGQRAAAAEQARRIISLYPENAHADSLRRLAAEP